MTTNKFSILNAQCLILIALFAILSGCSFLNVDMENKIAVSEIDYTKTADMYQPVIGAYSKLRWPGMHWVSNILWTGRDDDMTSGRTDDQQDALLFGYRGGYQCPNSFWGLRIAWINSYDVIRTCNSALEALDKYAEHIQPGSQDYADYKSYRGEVITISSWMYYMMASSFGPCVLLKDNNQTRFVRSTQQHVYEYVIAQLDSVIPDMKRMRPNQMPHQGLWHRTVHGIHGHVIAVVGRPPQGQFRHVTGTDHQTAYLVCHIHQDLGALPRLAVLVGDILHIAVTHPVDERAHHLVARVVETTLVHGEVGG